MLCSQIKDIHTGCCYYLLWGKNPRFFFAIEIIKDWLWPLAYFPILFRGTINLPALTGIASVVTMKPLASFSSSEEVKWVERPTAESPAEEPQERVLCQICAFHLLTSSSTSFVLKLRLIQCWVCLQIHVIFLTCRISVAFKKEFPLCGTRDSLFLTSVKSRCRTYPLSDQDMYLQVHHARATLLKMSPRWRTGLKGSPSCH